MLFTIIILLWLPKYIYYIFIGWISVGFCWSVFGIFQWDRFEVFLGLGIMLEVARNVCVEMLAYIFTSELYVSAMAIFSKLLISLFYWLLLEEGKKYISTSWLNWLVVLRLRLYLLIWKINKNVPKCHMYNGYANDSWIHISVKKIPKELKSH